MNLLNTEVFNFYNIGNSDKIFFLGLRISPLLRNPYWRWIKFNK